MTTEELIEKLQKEYPLFSCKDIGKGYVKVDFGLASMHVHIDKPIPSESFDREHKRLEIQYKLQEKYPYLHFYIGYDLKPHSIWVNRDGRDAEAIHYIIQDDEPYMQDIMLQHFNIEAKKAVQEGWFFCTGCNEAKPRLEYAYFHFAGNYCKECKDANPEAYRNAMNETYD